MADGRKLGGVEVVYGLVVGGLISTFVLLAVYIVFIEKNLQQLLSGPPMAAVVTGLLGCVILLAAGLYLSERRGWLGTALLFASGFTALWSVAIGSWKDRSLTLFALGVAVVVGMVMGWWRFGSGAGSAGGSGTGTAGTGVPVVPGGTALPDLAAAPALVAAPSNVAGTGTAASDATASGASGQELGAPAPAGDAGE